MMRKLPLFTIASFCLLCSAVADEFTLHTFDRQPLTDTYFSEGANAGDINRDGIADIVYGPYWFAGPDFKSKQEIYQPLPQNRNGYADHFFAWVQDFNADGWNDVFVVGFPGTPAYVYENPQADGLSSHWKKHQVFDWVSNESPQLTNLVGDERPELVCTRDGFFGFATVNWDDPFSVWEFHPVSDQVTDKKFGHGLGVGDVNGDRRLDIIHSKGWFEQPATQADQSRWPAHQASFTSSYGGAEMYAYDVDGDGDNDIITSNAAHHFGLTWYEQVTDNGEAKFKPHQIMGSQPSENRYGVVFSELHSVSLADIDGDGLKDVVTGKTYYSHHQGSPMWDAGAVVYWFKLVRTTTGVDWIPYKLDDQAGIGRQISVVDVNADALPDIVVGGMNGANVLLHRRTRTTQSDWLAAQPTLLHLDAAAGLEAQQIKIAAATRGPKASIGAKTGRADRSLEGESLLQIKSTAGKVSSQPMGHFKADRWSNDAQLWWTGGRPDATLSINLPPFNGIVDLELVLTCAIDYGIVQLSLDDQPLGKPIDLFNTEVVTTGVLSFPKLSVSGDQHALNVRIVGANPQAKPAYMFGLDFVRVKQADGTYLPATVSPPKLSTDAYPHAGLSAQQAAAAMTLPPGFTVTVGAAEPDVKQPIAMALDDRGRVWIAEAYEYPIRATGDKGRDRILIFEDTDGDGTLDGRKVFAEGLNLVSGLEVGFGGVWVGAAPYLLFIPDRDGDDKADSEPQVLLDGWGLNDTHETLNTFIWGPDGWLYGCHGVFTHSRVGKPGTADDQRVAINAGIWRYHPTKHEFEVFAHGTSNPWGVDFNDHGQAFITACVIPHLYHIIQGGRYQRQAGQHFNAYTYRDIATIADHLHYLGGNPHGGNNKSDTAGGGHAHAGAMIYLGDRWPANYRNQLLMNNIHGQRLNIDVLKTSGSGYVGSHAPDFLLTGDQASQILNLRYGPDGNAWMIDWYDMQACHRPEVGLHDRSNGRIYKIAYGEPDRKNMAPDLASRSDLELAAMTLSANDWFVRHSRRLLQERAAQRPIAADALESLVTIATRNADDTRRLRAIWALHVTNQLDNKLCNQLLIDPSPYVRGWTIQLTMERSRGQLPADQLASFVKLATSDESPMVRLYLASAAQQIPLEQRWSLIEALMSHPADAADHNLPLMYWYAAEPLADVDTTRALALAMTAGESIPLLREFMLQRIGSSDVEGALPVLLTGLSSVSDANLRLTFLQAIRASLRGQRQVDAPAEWAKLSTALMASTDAEVQVQANALGVTFGDVAAMHSMRERITAPSVAASTRLFALQSLLDAKDASLVPTLLSLLKSDVAIQSAAIRGMAQYDNASIAPALLTAYAELSPDQKRIALATLCARSASGIALLQAIEAKRIAGTDLTADLVRQLQAIHNPKIDSLLVNVWGTVRESAADKLKLIADYKMLVNARLAVKADPTLGREVFSKTCMKCHTLFGMGEKIGPDLTGSNRVDLDYLLSNIVDPSAVMAKEYRSTSVLLKDGRVVTGLLKTEDAKSLSMQTSDAIVVIPLDEIDERVESEKSMMPDDQLKPFSEHEIRSLIAYLQSKP